MQLGIRLHDVNTELGPDAQTMESRVKKAREEGFTCIHLAFSKVIKGVAFDEGALTAGLAAYTKRLLDDNGMDIAVLGCYLNLAHPDPEKVKEFQGRYFGTIRVASILRPDVVGTETGAPNAEYKMDAFTHGEAALDTFIRNLAPVVECAENYGVSMAIEPVYRHIVYDADRALKVLKSIASRNLRVILDPVNLLGPENADDRDYVIKDAIDKLGPYVEVVHLKDYIRADNGLKSVAAGTGEMDFGPVLKFMKERKPYIHATLENTNNGNAVAAKEFLRRAYEEI